MLPRLVAFLSIALLLACNGESPRPETAASAGTPVILISIDTLRADHLPAYGYTGVATPAIDALRQDGILYANAYSHCPMTLPSHLSILTGLLPYEHEVRNNIGYTFDGTEHDSLPAMLKREGYATGGAVSSFVLRSGSGVGALFDSYDDRVGGGPRAGPGELTRDGHETVRIAGEWIATRNTQPFFYFLHLFEPHWPYEAPEPFRSRYTNAYDAEIAAADDAVGQLIERLKQLGVYDRAVIVLLSDHGEGLGDHGEGEHGVFLYREVLRVPLIVKLPKSERRGETMAQPVQLIDIVPTIAALTGAKPKTQLAGTSLVAALPQTRSVYSETMLPRIHFGWSELRSLADANHKFIEAPRSELYDVSRDPNERTNIAGGERRVLAQMRESLAQHAAAFTGPQNVDAEEAAKLAALGYLGQAGASDAATNLPDPKDRIGELEALKAGAELERRGEVQSAAAKYASIVAANPRFTDGWLRLGAAQDRLGRLEDAVRSYRRAIEVSPVLVRQNALALASLYLRLRQYDDAYEHAQLVLTSQPAAAHQLLGRIALARGDRAAARREAQQAMQDPAYRDSATVLLATIDVQEGKLADALRVLDALKESARAPVLDLESTRGDVLARMERIAEAEAAFRQEIAAFPNNREAYARLAVLYAMLGRERDAEGTLEKMFEANRSASTAELAAETWSVVDNRAAAARWRERAARTR